MRSHLAPCSEGPGLGFMFSCYHPETLNISQGTPRLNFTRGPTDRAAGPLPLLAASFHSQKPHVTGILLLLVYRKHVSGAIYTLGNLAGLLSILKSWYLIHRASMSSPHPKSMLQPAHQKVLSMTVKAHGKAKMSLVGLVEK